MRLIDADYLIDYWKPDVGRSFVADYFMWTVDHAPTIDAVPVIRCKDCKYYEADLYANPLGVCCHREWIVNDTGHGVDEDGYCYRAERKEEP